MKILVIGGTKFFGVPMIKELLAKGHDVTVATRGNIKDDFGNAIHRIIFDRADSSSIKDAFSGIHFDVIIDKIAYCSNDIRNLIDSIDCDRFVHMSSTAVYTPLHWDTREDEFCGNDESLMWCNRADVLYNVGKQQAEIALSQLYKKDWLAVRYPFVIGTDDYTKRLLFYVEHTMKSIPMHVDNIDCQMGFIHSDEAGKLLAYLAERDITGAVNGCSNGTISIREILNYVEKKTGTKAVFDEAGEPAPYNGTPEYSINTEKAKNLGFSFTNLHDWIYDLLDYYIEFVKSSR